MKKPWKDYWQFLISIGIRYRFLYEFIFWTTLFWFGKLYKVLLNEILFCLKYISKDLLTVKNSPFSLLKLDLKFWIPCWLKLTRYWLSHEKSSDVSGIPDNNSTVGFSVQSIHFSLSKYSYTDILCSVHTVHTVLQMVTFQSILKKLNF